ncbi:DUF4870 domain-containing protein [Halovivax cerinus]|uniref:DUF4870 domain-containing protein n=1 Tax=Halovivax cerinus TaxID=1487865 RepID=A0ABD5NRZ7_9EURY|nr:DUF4870 domain-containing protein [Halovivax cerinus]
MSTNHRSTTDCTATTTETDAQPGPRILADRTLGGIFVHLLGLVSGFVLPTAVYLVSDHDFTRTNARNAINWQFLYAGLYVVLFGLLGVAVAIDTVAPESTIASTVAFAFALAFAIGFVGTTILLLANLAFGLIATGTAIFGSAWSYPFAPDFVGWFEASVGGARTRRVALVGYALTAPIAFAAVFRMVMSETATGELIAAGFAGATFLVVASFIAPAIVVRDVRAAGETRSVSPTAWVASVGVPLAVAGLTYLLATLQFESTYPAGDAIYAFAGAVWVVTVAFLLWRAIR